MNHIELLRQMVDGETHADRLLALQTLTPEVIAGRCPYPIRIAKGRVQVLSLSQSTQQERRQRVWDVYSSLGLTDLLWFVPNMDP